MEFDYEPHETLKMLATAIRTRSGPDSFMAPPASDIAFWAKTAEACGRSKEDGEQLADDVHADFASREFHLVSNQPYSLWMGDLCCTESRLAIQALGIKGVCTVASHGIDELWADDGVQYMTAIVTPTNSLVEQLEACVDFLQSHVPAIICCSSGIGASALVAAAFLSHTQPSLGAAAALQMVRCATVGDGRLDVSEEDAASLQAFCDAKSTHTPTAGTKPKVKLPSADEQLGLCPLLPSPKASKTESKAKDTMGIKLEKQETQMPYPKRARRAIRLDGASQAGM